MNEEQEDNRGASITIEERSNEKNNEKSKIMEEQNLTE